MSSSTNHIPLTLSAPVAEAFRRLCQNWPQDVLHETLWEVFRLAVLGGLKEADALAVEDRVSADQVAALFDQLTELIQQFQLSQDAPASSPAQPGEDKG